jgi:hypothetical protein
MLTHGMPARMGLVTDMSGDLFALAFQHLSHKGLDQIEERLLIIIQKDQLGDADLVGVDHKGTSLPKDGGISTHLRAFGFQITLVWATLAERAILRRSQAVVVRGDSITGQFDQFNFHGLASLGWLIHYCTPARVQAFINFCRCDLQALSCYHRSPCIHTFMGWDLEPHGLGDKEQDSDRSGGAKVARRRAVSVGSFHRYGV